MINYRDIIVAPATKNILQAISLIRVDGKGSKELTNKIKNAIT